MLNGWIKIHRKILDHWVAQEPELLAVWIRLLAEANHSDTKRMFNGRLITIQRGQTLFGLDAFSAKSGVSVSKLRRYMKLLEDDGMISRQKTNKYSLVSITCYDNYQSIDSQNAGKSQADDNQTTGKRQHRKNVKNDKECKEDIGDKSPDRFQEFWDVFADKRSRKAANKVWNRKKLDLISDVVIEGARKYVKIRGPDRQFWKQAQGWLNDERWEDEPIDRSIAHEENRPSNESRTKRVNDKLDEIARRDIEENGFTDFLG